MVQARCIQKFRDKNNTIKGYLLEDCNGQQLRIAPDQLKNAIFMKQINVVNLKLTKDGKLIDNTPEKINQNPIKSGRSDREIFDKLWNYVCTVENNEGEDKVQNTVKKLMEAFYGVEFKQLTIFTEAKVFYAGAILYEVIYEAPNKISAEVFAGLVIHGHASSLVLINRHQAKLGGEGYKERVYKIMLQSKKNAITSHANAYNMFAAYSKVLDAIEDKYKDYVSGIDWGCNEGNGVFFVCICIDLTHNNERAKSWFDFNLITNLEDIKQPFILQVGYPAGFEQHKDSKGIYWKDSENDFIDIPIEDNPNCIHDMQLIMVNSMKKALELTKEHSN